MRYYLLLLQKATSDKPIANVLSSTNITRREDQARGIFNNRDKKHIKAYGEFDPDKDVLIPINVEGDIPKAFGYEKENLELEDDEDISIVEVAQADHIHLWESNSLLITRSTITEDCEEDGCEIRRERQRYTSIVHRQYNRVTGEAVPIDE